MDKGCYIQAVSLPLAVFSMCLTIFGRISNRMNISLYNLDQSQM
jgi:hypothetical protein